MQVRDVQLSFAELSSGKNLIAASADHHNFAIEVVGTDGLPRARLEAPDSKKRRNLQAARSCPCHLAIQSGCISIWPMASSMQGRCRLHWGDPATRKLFESVSNACSWSIEQSSRRRGAFQHVSESSSTYGLTANLEHGARAADPCT